MNRIYDEIDQRFKLKELLPPILKHPVPEHAMSPIYCLGGISFLCFIILALSGIFLAFYYKPTPAEAYNSIVLIMTEVPFGSLIRSVHHWTANTMVAAVMAHMIRVYFTASYKKPRELNWLIGVGLFAITTTFGFSGYLLPWDQLAYWATTIGVNISGSIPVIGPLIARIMMGGAEIGAATLTRFFAIHVLILPATILGLLGLHFAMIRVQGISGRL